MKERAVTAVVMLAEALLTAGFLAAATPIEAADTTALPASVFIANASAEIAGADDSDMPAYWATDAWGELDAAFTVLDEGHFGSRSVKTEVTDYEEGDAKWYFAPIRLAPGDYRFSDYYRSDVDARVIAAVTMRSGDIQYIDMPVAGSSAGWTRYEAVFTMPEDGETVTVYHLLSRNGTLITDDYSIAPYRYTGFDRGLVTITFDDGWEENTTTALPIMREFGFKSNQFYATTFIENPCVANPKERIMPFLEEGHEIGSHSITHPALTSLSSQQAAEELAGSKAFLEDYLGIDIKYFASPYGAYDAAVNKNIMAYYTAHRTVDRGYNSKDNLDVSRLKCQSVLHSTTAEQIAGWIDKAKNENLWLILLYHKVTDDAHQYDTTPEQFYEHMRVLKDSGIPVVTISQALAELGNTQVKPSNHRVEYVIGLAAAALLGVILLVITRAREARFRFSIRGRIARKGERGSSGPHTFR